MNKTVTFNENSIKKYLESMVEFWRDKRNEADLKDDTSAHIMAKCYINAFQSVYSSLFGALVPKNE